MAKLLIDHEIRTVFPFKSVATLAHKISNNTHLEYVNRPIEMYVLLGYSQGTIVRKGNIFKFKYSKSRFAEPKFEIIVGVKIVKINYYIPF